MVPDDIKALVSRAVIEPWNNGNFHVTNELLAEKVAFHFRGQMRELNVEQMNAVIVHWRGAFPDFHFTIDDVIAEGDKAVLRMNFTGTHAGVWQGNPPTGKKILVTETLVCRIAGGRIVEMWEDYDEYGMRKQLGLAQ